MRLLSKTLIYFFLISVIQLNAQDYQTRQKKLEAQKISLKKEISQINILIADSKKRSKNLANDLEDLQLKISARDKLININNSQLNNLTSIINNQNDRIADLESDLINLKSEYEKIIYNSYKKRSTQMKLMFLFASENINQAFKRFQYFKQYSKYRKKQADRIVKVQNEIEDTVDSLVIRKNQKQKIIEENEAIKQSLSKEKKATR
ncbi:MAG: hypothetical protein CM15mP109_06860 [Candidatus Dadabacteria bacterium]|nr:MAG: hypothetical protein CM15mP109_06860 [Candidatus Dadabacteria bacterium]